MEEENIFTHIVAEKKLINDECPSIDIFDIDYFTGRLTSLNEAFPEPFFTHAMALKGNSLRGVIRIALKHGFGCECASLAEAMHALSEGCPSHNVIFDSPVKTKGDLKTALETGIVLNLDNEQEASIVDSLLKNECRNFKPGLIGLRINPVVGGGEIGMMSTATALSKFGVPFREDTKERIIELYKDYPWLNGIHFHVGSQGVPIEKFVDGAKVVMSFVDEIEAATGKSLVSVDIGGGLSTSYKSPEEPEEFAYKRYRSLLDKEVPQLFSGKYRIITEFGRSLLLKAGKSLTRINYIKHWLPDLAAPICLTHIGANQFPREVYLPHIWNHRFSALDGKSGKAKEASGDDLVSYELAGPLCFQGDFLGHNVALPRLQSGDIIVVHDTGGYCMSMYSKYNSITPSPVYGYEKGEFGYKIWCFKERETAEETLAFWGNAYPRIVN